MPTADKCHKTSSPRLVTVAVTLDRLAIRLDQEISQRSNLRELPNLPTLNPSTMILQVMKMTSRVEGSTSRIII